MGTPMQWTMVSIGGIGSMYVFGVEAIGLSLSFAVILVVFDVLIHSVKNLTKKTFSFSKLFLGLFIKSSTIFLIVIIMIACGIIERYYLPGYFIVSYGPHIILFIFCLQEIVSILEGLVEIGGKKSTNKIPAFFLNISKSILTKSIDTVNDKIEESLKDDIKK